MIKNFFYLPNAPSYRSDVNQFQRSKFERLICTSECTHDPPAVCIAHTVPMFCQHGIRTLANLTGFTASPNIVLKLWYILYISKTSLNHMIMLCFFYPKTSRIDPYSLYVIKQEAAAPNKNKQKESHYPPREGNLSSSPQVLRRKVHKWQQSPRTWMGQPNCSR